MNKQRRKETHCQISELEDVVSRISNLDGLTILDELDDLKSDIESIKNELEWIRDDEQDAFDNIPENLQYSYNAGVMEDNVSYFDESISSLEDALDQLDENTDLASIIEIIQSAITSLELID